MVFVQGNLRMVAVYGAISVLLFCLFNFGWFGIVQHGHTNDAARAAAQTAAAQSRARGQEIERKVNDFNTCLKAAETNLKKVHACQRARYGR